MTGRGLAADPHPPLAPHLFTSSGKHKLAAKSAGNSGKASDKKAKAPRALGKREWNKRYWGSISPATEADPLASNPAKLGQRRVDFLTCCWCPPCQNEQQGQGGKGAGGAGAGP